MNKQIKELVAQATTEESDGFKYFDKEKFAELIVRECANFSDKGTRGGIGELMKKHFGVKE